MFQICINFAMGNKSGEPMVSHCQKPLGQFQKSLATNLRLDKDLEENLQKD